jgi:hypothetical protein
MSLYFRVPHLPDNKQYEDAGLHPAMLENVKKCGYNYPTPIQAYTIPALLTGHDVVGIAQTGKSNNLLMNVKWLTWYRIWQDSRLSCPCPIDAHGEGPHSRSSSPKPLPVQSPDGSCACRAPGAHSLPYPRIGLSDLRRGSSPMLPYHVATLCHLRGCAEQTPARAIGDGLRHSHCHPGTPRRFYEEYQSGLVQPTQVSVPAPKLPTPLVTNRFQGIQSSTKRTKCSLQAGRKLWRSYSTARVRRFVRRISCSRLTTFRYEYRRRPYVHDVFRNVSQG